MQEAKSTVIRAGRDNEKGQSAALSVHNEGAQ